MRLINFDLCFFSIFLFSVRHTWHTWHARNRASAWVAYKIGGQTPDNHTFSAFWLRSSVVSVLISLISGTWRMASQEFKCIVYAVAWV